MLVQTIRIFCSVCKEPRPLTSCRIQGTETEDVFTIQCPECGVLLARQRITTMPRKVIHVYDFFAHIELRTTYNLPGAA